MSTITYGAAHAVPAAKAPSAPVRKRSGWFAAFMESRQKQAMLELRRHGLRLPRELEEAGMKINGRNEDALPFVR